MLLLLSLIFCFLAFFDFVNINFFYKKAIIFVIFIMFLFTAGGRYEFAEGGDWFIYKDYFEAAPSFGEYRNLTVLNLFFEPGFFIITCIIKIFSDHYIVFFTCIELLSILLLYSSLKEYTHYKLVSLLLYFPLFFLPLDLIMIRSLLAVQVFFYSIKYIVNRQFLKFSLAIAIATSIHVSSIILFPLYFFLNKHYSNKIIIGTIFFGFILLIFRLDFLSYVLGYLPITKVLEYSESETLGKSLTFSIKHIEFIFLLFFFIKFRHKLEFLNRKYFNVFFNMFFFYGILIFYFFGVNAFSGRLKFFFLPSILILLPYLISLSLKKRTIYSMYLFLCFYVFMIMIYIIYIREDGDIYANYKNFFLVSK